MSSGNLRLNMIVSADTTLAQQNMQQLATLLHSLSNTKIGFDSGSIKGATEDVKQLQLHLQNALNQNTGKLDLTKFNTSLKGTNTSLSQLSNSLISLGPTGEQAFVKLAAAISQAEAPMLRFGAKTQELLTTFANTAKWKLAASAINGITSSISDGISYIERFDKALTDIKIVSDINNKDLAKFAKNTHAIAKEVNSTSLDVAKGATIYFQQGLDPADVEERVKITEKMANITGETSETISSQLTAIWNNFAKGGEDLERYADILTYLGATTAADTNQIATAMQKFAAAADTVGLSYEYASSMVAEVIDRTQMAPEEVGTAMKTILTRLQGVELGETLEDGIDLNKYGEELKKVGIDVVNQMTGELKDADVILSELGAKWQTLDEGQKKALATTVAGVRQTTQFFALMGEWSDIESTVSGLGASIGYVNEKNEEWAKSLAGIKKAYTETKQEMYKTIFGDAEPLKLFYKGLTSVAEGVTGLVKQFGGIKPLILTIVAVFARQLMPKIIDGTRTVKGALSKLFGFTNSQTLRLKNEFTGLINELSSKGLITPAMKESLMLSQKLAETKNRLTEATKYMGTAEKEIVKFKIEQLEYATRHVQAEVDKAHALEEQLKLSKELLVNESKKNIGDKAAVNRFKESHADDEEYTPEKENKVIEMASNIELVDFDKEIENAPERVKQERQTQVDDLEAQKQTLLDQQSTQGQITEAYEIQQQYGGYDEGSTYEATYTNRKEAANALDGNKVMDATGNTIVDASQPILNTDTAARETLDTNLAESRQKELDIAKQIEEIDRRIKEINEGTAGAVEEEVAALQDAKTLKEDMVHTRDGFDEKTIVSTTETMAFNDDTKKVNQGANEIVASVTNKQDENVFAQTSSGGIAEGSETTFAMDSSIENLEALIMKREELNVSTEKLDAMNKEFAASLQQVEDASKKVEAAEKEEAKAVKGGAKSKKDAAKAAKNVNKAKKDEAKVTKQAKKAAQDYEKSIQKMIKSTLKGKSAKKALEDLKKASDKLAQAKGPKQVEKAMKSMQTVLKNVQKSAVGATSTIKHAVDSMGQELREAGMDAKALDNIQAEMTETGQAAARAKVDIEQLDDSLANAEAPAMNFGTGMANVVGWMGKMAGATQSAMQGVQTLMGAFTEAESPMEALQQYLSGLVMLLPMVSAAFEILGKAKKKDAAASLENAGATEVDNAAQKKNLIATAWAAAGKAVSQLSSMGPWGWVLGLAAAATIIAALIGAGMAMSAGAKKQEANKKEEDEAKKKAEEARLAAETTQQLSSQLQNAKQNAQDLESAFADYNSIADKLKNCKKGTEEWNEALLENNNKVAELLEKYPELAKVQGGITVGSDGQLIISEEAQQYVMRQASLKVAKAQVAVARDQAARGEKEEKEAKDKVKEAKSDTDLATQDAAAKLIEKYGADDAYLHASEIKDVDSKALEAILTAEKELADVIMANTAANEAQTLAIGAQMMTGQEDYENSAYKENIAAVVGDKTLESNEDTYQQVLSDISARNYDADYATEDDPAWDKAKNQPIWEEFKANTYGEGVQTRDVNFTETGVTGQYYDTASGEWKDIDVTNATIAQSVAASRQVEDNLAYGETMAQQINSFDNEAQADIFTAALTGDTTMLSPEVLAKSEDALFSMIDSMEISKETFEAMGDDALKFGDTLEEYQKNFKAYQKEIVSSAKGFEDFKKKGVAALTVIKAESDDVFDESGNKIGEWSKEAQDQAKALSKSLSAALGSDADLGLDADFINKNWDIINDFMNGVEGSGDRLRAALEEDAIIDVTAKFEGDAEMQAKIEGIHNELTSLANEDWQVGVAIDDTNFINKCNEMIETAGMTADQAQAYFGKMGYDVEVTTEKRDVSDIVWEKFYNNQDLDGDGQIDKTTVDAFPKVIKGQVEVPVIKTITPNASYGGNINNITKKTPAKTTSPRNPSDGSGGGGGGDNTPEKKDLTKRDEIVERYKSIDDSLEHIEVSMSKLEKIADSLWGAKRLKALKDINGQLRLQYDMQERKVKRAEQFLEKDQQNLLDYMVTPGENGLGDETKLQFVIDPETKTIANYDEVMNPLFDALEGYEKHYNSLPTKEEQEAYAESTLEPFRKKVETVLELINTYDETRQTLSEAELNMLDTANAIRENALETITYKIELEVEMNETDLAIIDYYFGKTEDDVYKLIEGVDLLNKKLEPQTKLLKNAYDPYNDILWEYLHGANGVTFEDVAQAAKDAVPEIISALETIRETDQEMLDYYTKGLEASQEHFEKYSQFIDNAANKMSHYKNMLGLIGKEMDYKKTGQLLEGQFDIAKSKVDADKAYYETLQSEYDTIYNTWLQKKDSLSEYELKMLEEKLYQSKLAVDAAEEQYLSSLETTGELAQAILENNLNKAQQKLEKSLFGMSAEDYMTDMERRNKLQEEFLTTTNKMYETNKLIHNAELAMEKTDNVRAKQQYQEYIKQIEQMQKKGKLSSYELSIAQAEYEVLKAKIALEEAQQSKSQVRLTRDAEGNYGYVYTANENKISQAEQALADAENSLYNVGLQGAQDYEAKYAQTMQEAIETFNYINEQYRTGQIASEEEYNQKMAEAKEYYYNLLSEYSDLYYEAHDTLVENSFEQEADYLLQGIGNLEDFATHTDIYLSDASDYFTEYGENTKDISEIVEGELSDLANGTSKVTQEAENVSEAIKNKVIPQMEKSLPHIRNVTSAYASQRKELEKTIKMYEQYLTKLKEVAQYGVIGFENIPDLSAEIANQFSSNGGTFEDSVIKGMADARWEKMGNEEDYDYSKLKADYLAADPNHTTEDPMYKTYEYLEGYSKEKTKDQPQKTETEKASSTNSENTETASSEVNADSSENKPFTLTDAEITWLATEVRNGVYGNGHETRKANLRAVYPELTDEQYDQIRKKVNNTSSSGPSGPSNPSGSQKNPWELFRSSGSNEADEVDGPEEKEPLWAFGLYSKSAKKYCYVSKFSYSSKTTAKTGAEGKIEAEAKKNSRLDKSKIEIKYFEEGKDSLPGDGEPYPTIPYMHEAGTTDKAISSTTTAFGEPITCEGTSYYKIGDYYYRTSSATQNYITRQGKKVKTGKTIAKGTTRYKKYDTGGYTGAWGPEGKLAVLHEKEIVLNKKDTENFLTATNILREISDVLDQRALIASLGAINLQAMTINSPADEVLRQEVTIHADFPNVTDHNEIELAIDNLINAASQHAYR